ncbi:divergent polysaccharide deacetylase family protein [Paenibacillus wynnii]|uniref:divergent polysaccharide deacetylase family protein n=1 Tax=Paenibacillus wynnii TaxID=268407 RepID=UPI000A0209E2|nr:divergent polysaccharide deacetylase family protein [Paenibacillus wynnii]
MKERLRCGWRTLGCRITKVMLIAVTGVVAMIPVPVAVAASHAVSPTHTNSARSQVALIIDDLGNGLRGTEEIFNLPVKLTVAVMPFLSTTVADATRAHNRGDDVLLHLPMEPRNGKPEWLGPGAVLATMSDDEVRERVEAALDNVPYAIGINNHMGSKVTSDERVMRIVLSVCRERGLFFVDSKTNFRSVVGKMSEEMGLPRIENQVFLDNTHSSLYVLQQMRLVRQKAMKSHYCVTIGHVGIQGIETAAGIRSGIDEMKGSVEFIGISDLLKAEGKWGTEPRFP